MRDWFDRYRLRHGRSRERAELNIRCRIGWHRYEYLWRVEDSQYGHEFVTRFRCLRPDCPQHLYWALCDAEPALPEIPAYKGAD